MIEFKQSLFNINNIITDLNRTTNYALNTAAVLKFNFGDIWITKSNVMFNNTHTLAEKEKVFFALGFFAKKDR
ncbi:MAG: hypothetical protein HeimC3_46390 [Candidatus Heimdallarchaeota archaeon LC_3]|nr:MAG: hypothetical protein HeimC3_46390 [Candidatus Heimdallarchaeota archaeon LC_3]